MANVILAFSMPYMALIPFGLGVLIIETVFFKLYQRGCVTWARAILFVITANIASFLVGFLLSGFMPSGIGPHGLTSPHYIWMMNLAFVWAFVLSWGIEWFVIRAMSKKYPLHKPVACVGIMNGISYALLWLICTLLWS